MTSQGPKRKDEDKDDHKPITHKLKDSLEKFKKNEKVEEIYNYATNNIRDTIAYVLMATGLILMFFEPPWYGSTLVGVIFGLYFGPDIYSFIKNNQKFMDSQGTVRTLILGGLILGFFIAAPFIFIGAAVAVVLRQL